MISQIFVTFKLVRIVDNNEIKEYNIDYYSIGRKEVLGRELVAENII